MIADVATEKAAFVVKAPMAKGAKQVKSSSSSALNWTYANGIATFVIFRAAWYATMPFDISWKMRLTTGAGALHPRDLKRVAIARLSRCSVHSTGHGAARTWRGVAGKKS